MAKSDAAPGLPDFTRYGSTRTLPLNKLLPYVVQEHKAKRAGCFTADALVLMADRTHKRIADVCVGDYVATPFGDAAVSNVWYNGVTKDWFSVQCGAESTTVTPNHAYFVRGVGAVPVELLEHYHGAVNNYGEIELSAQDLRSVREAVCRKKDSGCLHEEDVQRGVRNQVGAQAQRAKAHQTIEGGHKEGCE